MKWWEAGLKPGKAKSLANLKPPFEEGNTVAEKWTEEVVLDLLKKMWERLIKQSGGLSSDEDNIVQANDIKLVGEIRLMFGITRQTWHYWKKMHAKSDRVMDFVTRIEEISEYRLIHSGTRMDEFVLKNRFRYVDRQEVDHKNDGGKFEAPPTLDVSKLDTSVIEAFLKARKDPNE